MNDHYICWTGHDHWMASVVEATNYESAAREYLRELVAAGRAQTDECVSVISVEDDGHVFLGRDLLPGEEDPFAIEDTETQYFWFDEDEEEDYDDDDFDEEEAFEIEIGADDVFWDFLLAPQEVEAFEDDFLDQFRKDDIDIKELSARVDDHSQGLELLTELMLDIVEATQESEDAELPRRSFFEWLKT